MGRPFFVIRAVGIAFKDHFTPYVTVAKFALDKRRDSVENLPPYISPVLIIRLFTCKPSTGFKIGA